MGTNISRFYMLSRIKRYQKRENRLANSFFMLISNFRIKISGGGGFEIRYFNLFLVPVPKQKRLEKWAWWHWKALFLQIMNYIKLLNIRSQLTKQSSSKVLKSIFDDNSFFHHSTRRSLYRNYVLVEFPRKWLVVGSFGVLWEQRSLFCQFVGKQTFLI